MNAAGRSTFQSRLDVAVILALRFLQIAAVAVLLCTSTMGLVRVYGSYVAFYHLYVQPQATPAESQDPLAAAHRPTVPAVPVTAVAPAIPLAPVTVAPAHAAAAAAATAPAGSAAAVERHGEHNPIHIAFEGLEFLLLAPLCFLVLRSLSEYVVDLNIKEDHSLKEQGEHEAARQPAADGGGGDSGTAGHRHVGHHQLPELGLGKECLLDAKALSIGLLFAIIATHMVGKLISGELSAGKEKAGGVSEMIVGLCLLVILAGAYFGIEFLAHKIKSTSNMSSSPNKH